MIASLIPNIVSSAIDAYGAQKTPVTKTLVISIGGNVLNSSMVPALMLFSGMSATKAYGYIVGLGGIVHALKGMSAVKDMGLKTDSMVFMLGLVGSTY